MVLELRMLVQLANPHLSFIKTLGSVNQNISSIPLPSSAVKRSNSITNIHSSHTAAAAAAQVSNNNNNTGYHQLTHGRSLSSLSNSRMSLAPPGRPSQLLFQRSSFGVNVTGDNIGNEGGSHPRNSMAPGMFGNGGGVGSTGGGRKSFAPGSMTASNMMATPAYKDNHHHELQRRSSVYNGRTSTPFGQMMSGGGGAGGMGSGGGGGGGSGGMAGPQQHQSFFATMGALPAAMAAGGAGGVPQDPRRLRDASVRHQMAQELMEFLTMGNFEMDMKHSLTQKSMTSPTQKDFNFMFQWLYRRIDPAYKFQKSIEAEVPGLLKQMRYPFEKSIMKSQISAVGGNNWSTFLGLLHWMMQLAKMMERYSMGAYDEACAEAGFDATSDRIIFQFLTDAYRDWLSVEDDDDDGERLIKPHLEAMATKFEEANAHHLEHTKLLEAEHKALQDQIDELEKSAPRVAKLEEQIKSLEEDRGKFEQYNSRMEEKVERGQKKISIIEEEIERIEGELKEAEREKAELQEMVDQQGITVQDIDRMNSERERLQKGLESTGVRLEESRSRVKEKEEVASGLLDELERLVERYDSLAYQIGLVPSMAANAKGNEYELRLMLNEGMGPAGLSTSQLGRSDSTLQISSSSATTATADSRDRLLADGASTGYQPHHLLNLDLKGTVKNNIMSLRKDVSDRRNAALETDMNNHDLLDKIKEAIDDKQSEVDALGHRVRAAEEEFEKTREVFNCITLLAYSHNMELRLMLIFHE